MSEARDIPDDWEHPKWEVYNGTHGWRNYATKRIEESWGGFSSEQKQDIAEMLEDIASREDWD